MNVRKIALFFPVVLLSVLPFCVLTVLEATGDYSGQHTDAAFLLGFVGGGLSVAASIFMGPAVRKWAGLPAFGPLPAHQEESITFSGPADAAFKHATRAIEMLGKVTESDPISGTVEGLRGWHPLSSGEHLRIRIKPSSPEQSTIVIESAPLRDTIQTDEGSSALNVRALAREIITPTTHYWNQGIRVPIEPKRSST